MDCRPSCTVAGARKAKVRPAPTVASSAKEDTLMVTEIVVAGSLSSKFYTVAVVAVDVDLAVDVAGWWRTVGSICTVLLLFMTYVWAGKPCST